MVQAFHGNIIFPNRQEAVSILYTEGIYYEKNFVNQTILLSKKICDF